MIAYFLDRILPGLIVGAVMSVSTWLSHRRLKKHITRTASRQNLHFEQLAAEQTAALAVRKDRK